MFLVFMFLWFHGTNSQENNVCPTFKDYYTVRENPNCWYDFAAAHDITKIITLNGYEVLEYKVPTQDGVILTLFRIPSKNPDSLKSPVFIQHGIYCSAAIFTGIGKDSLAFVLSDNGYDVWLGNYRGTEYAQEHVNKTLYDEDFWDYSMDEIVAYDLPAVFSTILANTDPNAKITYVGHSLGTTLGLMFAAEFPEIAENTIGLMVFMGPAYTLLNIISPYRLLAPFGTAIVNIVWKLEIMRLLSQAEPSQRFFQTVCLDSPPMIEFCEFLYNLFYGPKTMMRPEIIPVYYNQVPGGGSLKLVNHAADLTLGNFRKYNYLDENMKYYGTEFPPNYDIKKIRVPIFIYYSTNDWATTEADALNLWANLPEVAKLGIKKIDLPRFNHMDFIYSRETRTLVYDHMVEIINKFRV